MRACAPPVEMVEVGTRPALLHRARKPQAVYCIKIRLFTSRKLKVVYSLYITTQVFALYSCNLVAAIYLEKIRAQSLSRSTILARPQLEKYASTKFYKLHIVEVDKNLILCNVSRVYIYITANNDWLF